ncbi:MAG: hypothetical protein NTV34_12900, partial [Proteobacteria bacterium]|nr:hypothetical protein [Pseudomonadota bacterium]
TYVLRQTLLTLESHIKNNKPSVAGAIATNTNIGAKFNFAEKHYAAFLKENNLQLYCDIRKIEKFYLIGGQEPLLDPIDDANLDSKERKKKMLKVYLARAKSGEERMSAKEIENRDFFGDETGKQAS